MRALLVALCGILSLPGAMMIATTGLVQKYFSGLSYFASLGLLFQRRSFGQQAAIFGIPILTVAISVVADVINP